MKIIICNDYYEMSRRAAYMIAGEIIQKPETVLGMATGDTPKGLYSNLVDMYKNNDLDFSEVTTFNLDEYYGFPPEHHQSYAFFMREHLINHININPDNFNMLEGCVSDVDQECKQFEEKIIQAGGIDIQILGIGNNGHIGFNEPDSYFEPHTRMVDLDESTIEANKRFFESYEEVPRTALSMGISTIMKSKKVVLLASGLAKAAIIEKLITGKIDPMLPASVLKLHNDVVLIIDKEAATNISSKSV